MEATSLFSSEYRYSLTSHQQRVGIPFLHLLPGVFHRHIFLWAILMGKGLVLSFTKQFSKMQATRFYLGEKKRSILFKQWFGVANFIWQRIFTSTLQIREITWILLANHRHVLIIYCASTTCQAVWASRAVGMRQPSHQESSLFLSISGIGILVTGQLPQANLDEPASEIDLSCLYWQTYFLGAH